jgi:uncharacterized protein YjdB
MNGCCHNKLFGVSGVLSNNEWVTVNPLPALISGPSTLCPGSTVTLSDATPGGTWSSSNSSIATVGSTGIMTGVSPGVVTINYTSSLGCVRPLSVTVNSLPPAISGPSVVCAGSLITLTNSLTGYWSTSSTTATVGGSSAA